MGVIIKWVYYIWLFTLTCTTLVLTLGLSFTCNIQKLIPWWFPTWYFASSHKDIYSKIVCLGLFLCYPTFVVVSTALMVFTMVVNKGVSKVE